MSTTKKNKQLLQTPVSSSSAYQKAISSAYGSLWDKYKNKIIFGSWLDDDDIDDDDRKWVKENCYTGSIPDVIWRPKALYFLESNNGWTRINDDGSNLPYDRNETIQDEHIMGFLKSDGVFEEGNKPVFGYRVEELFRKKKITHFRTIRDFGAPVY